MVPEACDTRLDLHRIQLRGNDHTYWGIQHASHLDAWYQWRIHIRDGPAVAAEALSYPGDEYIRWYRGITWVYISNPINRDARSHRYQPASVDRRMMEVDDMASVVIQEPHSSPSQMHDIQQTFPVQPSRRHPLEHVPDRGAHGVKKGARRHPGHGAGDGRPPVPPAPERHKHVDPGHVEVERGEGS
ncbi:hypothetical protein M9H77_14176 [Catharanthus roseus]|uniref:Uncharacterized protein n=1 Tax=Catharanthus roseus TaxID=4058 RepID=A0ACC0BMK1_CATRO|nr:hypothetical protein M9H77_14176 [Catharanthus roseus]